MIALRTNTKRKVKNGKPSIMKIVNIKSGDFLTIITYEIKDGKVKFLSEN